MASQKPSREDLIAFLRSVGTRLPPDTKLVTESLEKRVQDALAYGQQQNALIHPPFTPSDLKPWKASDGKTSAFDAANRTSVLEYLSGGVERLIKVGEGATPEDVYKELRQDVLTVAVGFDENTKNLYFVDSQRQWGVHLKLLEVRVKKREETIPVFLVGYRPIEDDGSGSLRNEALKDGMQITSSPLERRFLLRLLSQNASLLDPGYIKEQRASDGLQLSFLLPLHPFDQKTLGKLTADPGCDVCGQTSGPNQVCARCYTAHYCSKECQLEDWPRHKVDCAIAKQDVWEDITVETFNPGMYRTTLNMRGTTTPSVPERISAAPPRNIHGDKGFIVKMQAPVMAGGSNPPHILMYDRERSFQVMWRPTSNPKAFAEAVRKMVKIPKVYLYAKHVGDFKFKICLNRLPPVNDIVW